MKVEAENINPYANDSRHKGEQVRTMFDNIAPAYDFMNRAMTLGIDTRWRKKAVKMLKDKMPSGNCKILDIATGTGDLAIMLARAIPNAHITGVDLSEGMVKIGRSKVKEANLENRIDLAIGDSLALPFDDNTFDGITVAFGVRNFESLSQGYAEMARVMRPGGTLCVIELSTPTSAVVKPFYKFYTGCIIPTVGRLISHDNSAYKYLPQSIAAVPQANAMNELIAAAGLYNPIHIPLTFGVCTIYMAQKR